MRDDRQKRLIEIFELATLHYRFNQDIPNEDRHDPNYPRSFNPKSAVDARKTAVVLIKTCDEEFQKFLDSEESAEQFFIKAPEDTSSHDTSPYNTYQIKDLFGDATLSDDYKHYLSVVILNQFVNYLDEQRPKLH